MLTDTVTLELPEIVLLQALRQLPPLRRQWLLRQLEQEQSPTMSGVPAAELDKITGLISVGGDALEDSKRLYDE